MRKAYMFLFSLYKNEKCETDGGDAYDDSQDAKIENDQKQNNR